MREGRCSGVLPLLGVGLAAWVVPMSALADSVETPYFRATSASDLEILDETRVRVLGPGAGPFDVRFELLDDWFYEDGSASPRDERLVDLTIFRKICRTDEEQAEISLWYPTNPHLRTATIEAKDFPKHHLYLYPSPEKSGVSLSETVPAWTIKERARHKSTGFVPLAVKDLKTDMVSAPAVESGVYPHGEYECTYSTSWSWPECAYGECYAQASATTVNEVHALSLEQGEASDGYRALGEKDWNIAYIGLDRTDEGKEDRSWRVMKAAITAPFEYKKEYEWKVGAPLRISGSATEESVRLVLDTKKNSEQPRPSESFMGCSLSCKARISGCHGDCAAETTVATNLTVVAVDVIIRNKFDVTEDEEETEGAYLYCVEDAPDGSWTKEGTNALCQVVFSVTPNNLPDDQLFCVEYPEGTLFECAKDKKGDKKVYSPARNSYTKKELEKKEFWLHGHERSKKFKDGGIRIVHENSGAVDVAKFTVLGRPLIVPDYNRNGMIEDDEVEVARNGTKVFRHWINDDDDGSGKESRDINVTHNIPGKGEDYNDSKVNGRCDLLDFAPLWLNLDEVLPKAMSKVERYEVMRKLKWTVESKCVNVVWTGMNRFAVNEYQTKDIKSCGETLSSIAYESSVGKANSSLGAECPDAFSNFVAGSSDAGIVLVEGTQTGDAIEVVCSYKGNVVSRGSLRCRIDSVENMYRWVNLREAVAKGQKVTLPKEPSNYPDSETDGLHYIHVHGYNVNVESARGFGAEIFKRLWQTGMNSMFTVVDWPGDDSQFKGLRKIKVDVTPHYWANVYNAFKTAPIMADVCNQLPGRKIMIGHSLGAIVVCSAVADYELECNKVVLIDGAVAVQAFNPEAYEKDMVDSDWEYMDRRHIASEWYKLFEKRKEDFRYGLNWIGRFQKINGKLINFYSSTEDVVGNSGLLQFWRLQENKKGLATQTLVKSLGLDFGGSDAGWGIPWYVLFNPFAYGPFHGLYGSYFKDITEDELIKEPPFKEFIKETERMHSTETFIIGRPGDRGEYDNLRAFLLADAIPATSYGAGGNPIFKDGTSIDMSTKCKNVPDTAEWPRKRGEWWHSDLKDVAYFFVEPLYKMILEKTR